MHWRCGHAWQRRLHETLSFNKTGVAIMVKSVSRILLEEFQNIDEFADAIVENVDEKILNVLLETPLYRGVNVLASKFGKKEIRTNRMPYTNSLAFQFMLDREFIKRGFCARRHNSVFVTGSLSLAENFGTKIIVVFPPRGFCFTWNRLLRDVTLLRMVKIGGYSEIEVDVEKAVNEIGADFVETAIIVAKDIYGSHAPDSIRKTLNRLAVDVVIDKNFTEKHKKDFIKIWHHISEKAPKLFGEIVFNIFVKLSDKYGNVFIDSIKKLADVFKFSEDSKVIRAFTNEGFEEAVKSGHEIMIHAPYYFYIEKGLYENKAREVIIKKLNRHG